MKAQIKNRKIKNNKLQKGYTLVELLAASSIIVIVSGLIVGILYSTLRGSNKTKVTNDVAQNGNFALSIISNAALNAEDVTRIGANAISDCTIPQTGSSIEFQKTDGTAVTYSCDAATESITSTVGTTSTYLMDNDAVKVKIDPLNPNVCSFTCSQNNANPYSQPVINVKFIVFQRNTTAVFESAASSSFNTSVTMRNYNPR